MSDTAHVDDFLAHFGVKGMKWGKHSARSDSGSSNPGKSKAELRALNKASAAKDEEKRRSDIDAARERYNTSARKNYLDAKAQYKVDRAVIGKREALKAFNKVKEQNQADYEKSQEIRDGKEAAAAIIATVAVGIAATALKTALNGR